jgi:hypothetical protein
MTMYAKTHAMIKLLSPIVLFAIAYSAIFNYFAYLEGKVNNELVGRK